MITAIFAAAVLLADVTPTAGEAAPAQAPAAAPAAKAREATAEQNANPKKQAGNALICKNEPVLGSRLPTKRCRTTEQMAQQRQEDQANLDKMQRQGDPGH
jgi:hypothetical protein